MAYYSIFPEKDATIYSNPDRDTLNTGNDEILELVKEKAIIIIFIIHQEFLYNLKILKLTILFPIK